MSVFSVFRSSEPQPVEGGDLDPVSGPDHDQFDYLLDSVRSLSAELHDEHARTASFFRGKLDSLERTVAELYPMAASAHSAANAEAERNSILAAENAKLLKDLEDARHEVTYYSDRASQLEDRNATLASDLEARNGNVEDLERDLGKQQGRANELMFKNAALERRTNALAEENRVLKDDLIETQDTIQRLKQENMQLIAEASQTRTRLKTVSDDYEKVSRLYAAEAAAHQKVRTLLDDTRKDLASVEKDLAQKDRHQAQIQKRYEERVEQVEKERRELDVKISAMAARNEYTEGLLGKQRDEIKRCYEHINNLERSNRNLLEDLSRYRQTGMVEMRPAEPVAKPAASAEKRSEEARATKEGNVLALRNEG